MLSYKAACDIFLQQGEKYAPKTQTLPLKQACGHVCAEDITARVANQPFDNSAMDGFAVRVDDLSGASENTPVILTCQSRIAAGDGADYPPLKKDECYEIMTGAPTPKGAEAVVPVELVEKNDHEITFRAAPKQGDNIRRAGEDFQKDDVLIAKGSRLTESHILPLSTAGVADVAVFDQPKIGLVTTGEESISDLRQDLKPGQIYNSNDPYLNAAVPMLNAVALDLGPVGDDPEAFQKKVTKAVEQGADVIVSTGAVSMGAHDFVPSVLKEMGADIFFHKMKIRPGKPILFARLPDNGPFFFGLPGNPVSAAAGLRFFVAPLLRAMYGLAPERPFKARLENGFTKRKPEFTFFLKARHWIDEDGQCRAEILPGQESFKVGPFTQMTGWVVGNEGAETLDQGSMIDLFPLWPRM